MFSIFLIVSPHLSVFCFSVGRSCMRCTCSDGVSPSGSPRTRGRSEAEPLAGFLGEPEVVCRARRWCFPESPLRGALASPTSSAPSNWRLMVIGSLVPSCSSHVGTIPIYHFETWMIFQPLAHGFWLKNNNKKNPTSENVKYLKPP